MRDTHIIKRSTFQTDPGKEQGTNSKRPHQYREKREEMTNTTMTAKKKSTQYPKFNKKHLHPSSKIDPSPHPLKIPPKSSTPTSQNRQLQIINSQFDQNNRYPELKIEI